MKTFKYTITIESSTPLYQKDFDALDLPETIKLQSWATVTPLDPIEVEIVQGMINIKHNEEAAWNELKEQVFNQGDGLQAHKYGVRALRHKRIADRLREWLPQETE